MAIAAVHPDQEAVSRQSARTTLLSGFAMMQVSPFPLSHFMKSLIDIWVVQHPTGYCVECLFLADYAEYLTGECAIVPPYSSNYGDICGGQMFSPDQWNVVLQWDNTCGPA